MTVRNPFLISFLSVIAFLTSSAFSQGDGDKHSEAALYEQAYRNQVGVSFGGETGADTPSRSFLSWVPEGEGTAKYPDACSPRTLERIFARNPENIYRQKVELEEFFNRCDPVLKKGELNYYYPYAKILQSTYDYMSRSEFSERGWVSPHGRKIKYRIGLKKSDRPLPLVIVQCGIHCDLKHAALRVLTMGLFDSAPFHIVLLPSVTGADFYRSNGNFLMGGFDEGREIFTFAKFLQSPQFKDSQKISRVHLIGISLGGLSTFYANLYNSYELNEKGEPYISSFLAGCPVVDLRQSISSLFQPSITGYLLFQMTIRELLDVVEQVPIVGQLLQAFGGKPGMKQLPEFIGRASTYTYGEITRRRSWGTPPLEDLRIRSVNDFWEASDFTRVAKLGKGPVMVWASENDATVRYNENVIPLERVVGRGPQVPYQLVISKRGGHCNFVNPYGLNLSSTLLKDYFISQSPELYSRRKVNRRKINFTPEVAREFRRQSADEKSVDYKWRAFKNYEFIELSAKFEGVRYIGGSPREPMAHRYINITRKEVTRLHLKGLGLPREVGVVPANDAEAQALTRWLNANLWILSARGTQVDLQNPPTHLEWISY